MILRAYSVRDSKANMYNIPYFAKSEGEATRTFDKLRHDPQSIVCSYPDDFDLFYIGDYDDQEGTLKPLPTPMHIVKAAHLAAPNITN